MTFLLVQGPLREMLVGGQDLTLVGGPWASTTRTVPIPTPKPACSSGIINGPLCLGHLAP